MNNHLFSLAFAILLGVLSACGGNDEELIFDKSADERVAEATSTLEQKLAAPTNGWIMRYQPVPESGTYNVLLNFDQDGGVRIRTDFGANDNEFYDQRNTFRVDNSLGLELIVESYSFFSYLFERDNASFEAEYEFVYVNETPNGELVFTSKTDLSFTSSTIIVLEPAPDNAESLLGRSLNNNLDLLSETLALTSPVYRLNYANRDLSLYLSLDSDIRNVSFTYATTLSGERGQPVTFTTGYTIEGNSMILAEPLAGNFSGNEITLSAINFSELVDAPGLLACNQTIPIQQYQGTTAEMNEAVALLPTFFDPAGASFRDDFTFFNSPLGFFFDNGTSVGQQMADEIPGVNSFQFYYIDDQDEPFIAMGYLILGENDNATFALKDFTATVDDNRIQFEFADDYTLYNDTTAMVNTEALDFYVNKLTENNEAYLFKLSENVFEMYNPCNGWSALFGAFNN